MPDVEVVCPTCKGARYNEDTLDVTYNGKNISEILNMSIEEGVAFFADQRLIHHKLNVLYQLGMGYLQIGHPATILSGGEAQRVKLANELGKIKRTKHNLYILDEPTTGLHIADVQKLLDSLNRLVDSGHTVVVIEHHLDVIKPLIMSSISVQRVDIRAERYWHTAPLKRLRKSKPLTLDNF